jgi:hydrogenase expression/formation protein HypD
MTVYQAKRLGVQNFSLLVSHVLVPPAIAAIMESPTCRVQAFLAAGHVCSVMGTQEYPPLAEKYQVPIVVTGFEPLDILEGIRRTVVQLEEGRHELENPTLARSATRGTSRPSRCCSTSSSRPTGPGEASG